MHGGIQDFAERDGGVQPRQPVRNRLSFAAESGGDARVERRRSKRFRREDSASLDCFFAIGCCRLCRTTFR